MDVSKDPFPVTAFKNCLYLLFTSPQCPLIPHHTFTSASCHSAKSAASKAPINHPRTPFLLPAERPGPSFSGLVSPPPSQSPPADLSLHLNLSVDIPEPADHWEHWHPGPGRFRAELSTLTAHFFLREQGCSLTSHGNQSFSKKLLFTF